MKSLNIVRHPLIQHKLTIMRDKKTETSKFRQLLHEISMLLAYEVTRDLALVDVPIETPLCAMKSPVIDGKKIVVVSVLRAGNGILDGFLTLIPAARVGHIGIARDHVSLEPKEYYYKMPENVSTRDMIVVDPMLATGGSAVAAITRLKKERPRSLKFVCLVAAPEGVQRLSQAHPDVPIYTAALDQQLNEKGYIVPGLGDAGDRIYGTK